LQNNAFVYLLFGLTLGFFFTSIDSFASGRILGGLLFGLLGGVITAAFAALAMWVGMEVYQYFRMAPQWEPLQKTIALQAVILAIIGVGLAVSLALPYRQLKILIGCVLGCVLGAVLAALVYPVAMSVLIPTAHTDAVVPTVSTTRLAWLAIASILIGLTVTGLGKRKKKPQPT
jgi:hypothetical protein